MEFKREKIIAYCAAVVLLGVGIVCFAALPKKQPEVPVRIMFQTTGGRVLFSHNVHASEAHYGFYCVDCHHYWDEGMDEKPVSCAECHMEDSGEEGMPKKSDALHQQCIGCHEDMGGGPVDCSSCHVL